MNKIKLTTKEELLRLKEGDELIIVNYRGFESRVVVTQVVDEHVHYNYNDTINCFSINLFLKNNSTIVEVYRVINDQRYKFLSESDFTLLAGRKFALWFKNLSDVGFNPLSVKYIEGNLENFNPKTNVILNSEKYGFNIIPFTSVVQMLEIN